MCCASAGAERRGGVLCADPAYVVIPQGKKNPRYFNQQTCIKILCCKARAMELLPLHEIKVLELRCTAKRCAMDSARRELSIGERAVG